MNMGQDHITGSHQARAPSWKKNAKAGNSQRRAMGAKANPSPQREGEAEVRAAIPVARARMCVGCGESADMRTLGPSELIRLVIGAEGDVVVDSGDSRFGRGVYVHPSPDCVQKAVNRGLAKASKGKARLVRTGPEAGDVEALSPASLSAAIRSAMEFRVAGLLSSALRTKTLIAGAEAASAAYDQGQAKLLVVAQDAAAGADFSAVQRAIAEGNAVAFSNKEGLGHLCAGRNERMRVGGISVIALNSPQIAKAVRDAVRAAQSLDIDYAGAKRPAKTNGQGRRGSGGRDLP